LLLLTQRKFNIEILLNKLAEGKEREPGDLGRNYDNKVLKMK